MGPPSGHAIGHLHGQGARSRCRHFKGQEHVAQLTRQTERNQLGERKELNVNSERKAKIDAPNSSCAREKREEEDDLLMETLWVKIRYGCLTWGSEV